MSTKKVPCTAPAGAPWTNFVAVDEIASYAAGADIPGYLDLLLEHTQDLLLENTQDLLLESTPWTCYSRIPRTYSRAHQEPLESTPRTCYSRAHQDLLLESTPRTV